jgi:lysophospholipid acyltransferase (LPLAT)-like uncharacterized protein
MNEVKKSPQTKDRASAHPRKMTWWRRLIFGVLAPVAAVGLRLWWSFFRFEVEESESYRELERQGRPMVFAIWHEGLLTICWYAAGLLKSGVKATFLISPSVDGEIGVLLLAEFGSRAVRGSARRSGAAALRGLHRAIVENGQSPFITLDGSKGPYRYCKPGAIMVARMSGAPIVPIGVAAKHAWRAPTWDHHIVPMPFSKVLITVGEPMEVPRKMAEDEVESFRSGLEIEVNRLMGICEQRLRVRRGTSSSAEDRRKEEP